MEFRRSRAVQGRQGRWTVRSAQHEWRTHRRSTASGAVPIKLKVAKGTAVHAAVAFVRLPLLLQHHAPPFCAGVLEPDLRTHRNHTVECIYVSRTFAYSMLQPRVLIEERVRGETRAPDTRWMLLFFYAFEYIFLVLLIYLFADTFECLLRASLESQ